MNQTCQHARVVITYQAPIYVTVEKNRVTRVRVNDEAAIPDRSVTAECCDCHESLPITALFDAIETAETVDDWPGWEMGA